MRTTDTGQPTGQGLDLAGATALVTGANRGMGAEFVRQLLDRGAVKVWAAARRPDEMSVLDGRVAPLRLDVTDGESVEAAARLMGEDGAAVDLVVNNAGIATTTPLVTGDLTRIRAEMDVHFWGTLAVTRATAPLLGRRSTSALLNVMSLLSFRPSPGNSAYAAAKAAEWMLTNNTRLELAGQGTRVVALHVGSVDTDMMAGWDVPKNSPVAVVGQALDGVEAGVDEVLADEDTRAVKALLSAPPEVLYASFAVDG